jgi:predicted DNA-binding transcriptional regulator AlpA
MESFSIDSWCLSHGFSRAFYYKLAKRGQAPRTFKIGAAVRISAAAAAEWLAAKEAAQTDVEAARKLSANGRQAVAARKDRGAAATI